MIDRRKLLGAGAGIAGTLAVGMSLPGSGTAVAAQRGEFNTSGATPVALGEAAPPEYANPTNWPSENGTLQSTRAMAESGIAVDSVAQLGVAWSTRIDTSSGYGAFVAAPVIVDDIVYQQDAMSNVHALDKNTGEILWTNTYEQPVPSGGPNGIAVAYGRAYFSVGQATVHAVDALTGEEIWENSKLEGPLGEGICMAPLVYDNTVYISTIPGGLGDFYRGGQRGVFYALDASNGNLMWYWETVNDNLWGNPRVNSGGGLWHPPTVDEQGNVYLAIANAAPYPGTDEWPDTSSRPGDNPYTNHVVSLDIATGGMNWGFSVTGHDPFDLDNHLSPISAHVTVDGADTHMIFTSGKHGIVVGVNAETGEEVWRTPVGKHQNSDLDSIPEGEEIEVYPGTQGGVQTPMAYAEGVIFLPIVNSPSYFTQTTVLSGQAALPTATGQLVALDAATGEVLWDVTTNSPLYGGASVANDVVFSAGLDGVVRGFNVANGEQVFSYQASAGINSPLALSGDYLFVPAGTAFFPSADSADPDATPAPTLTALKIGGEVQGTPVASPAS
ncbi:MAG TPA: PQQ-binding-like beta-propeller repeat protein [Thermomicrobiales bacterium]|nr:PQQ-binding-like beta-propeller repeat protein [Thermomicrobiales bacterium]